MLGIGFNENHGDSKTDPFFDFARSPLSKNIWNFPSSYPASADISKKASSLGVSIQADFSCRTDSYRSIGPREEC